MPVLCLENFSVHKYPISFCSSARNLFHNLLTYSFMTLQKAVWLNIWHISFKTYTEVKKKTDFKNCWKFYFSCSGWRHSHSRRRPSGDLQRRRNFAAKISGTDADAEKAVISKPEEAKLRRVPRSRRRRIAYCGSRRQTQRWRVGHLQKISSLNLSFRLFWFFSNIISWRTEMIFRRYEKLIFEIF